MCNWCTIIVKCLLQQAPPSRDSIIGVFPLRSKLFEIQAPRSLSGFAVRGPHHSKDDASPSLWLFTRELAWVKQCVASARMSKLMRQGRWVSLRGSCSYLHKGCNKEVGAYLVEARQSSQNNQTENSSQNWKAQPSTGLYGMHSHHPIRPTG